jgi:hypothetical protein
MTCPNCGADVPPKSKACPECGSCEETGWSEAAESSGLNLPGQEEFNYDEFVEKEFGGKSPKPRGISWFWWVVAILLLAALLLLFLKR